MVLNKNYGNTYLQDAIAKEMENAKVKFHILPNGKKAINCYQFVNGHMVFNIIMEDFRRNGHLMVGCHLIQMLRILHTPA